MTNDRPGAQSGEDASKIAADFLNINADDVQRYASDPLKRVALARKIRTLAGSVLRQKEPLITRAWRKVVGHD